MKRMYRPLAIAAVTLAVAAGGAAQSIEKFASFEMTWPQRSPEEVSARVNAAVEAITGQKPKSGYAKRPYTPPAEGGRVQVKVAEAPALEISYLPDYDEIRISDIELAASTSPEKEISRDEAVAVAKKAFEQLAARKLVNASDYNWERVDVASTWVGGGSLDGHEIEEKKRVEYRLTLRRQINGIEVANAGVRIGVHASGRVSALRIGGVAVASKTTDIEQPTGKGRWLTSKTSVNDLQERFAREIAVKETKPKVAWARVMYVMPENQRTAVVAPLYVVSYSVEVPTDEGQTAVSRRRTIGYSLVDPQAAPVDLTPPVRKPDIEKTIKKDPYK